MALSVCGLRDAARRAYEWLRTTQRADGSWPRQTARGAVTDPAGESNHAAYLAVGVWHEFLVTGDAGFAAADVADGARGHRVRARPADAARRDHLAADGRRHAGQLRAADRLLQHLPEPALRGGARRATSASRSPTGNSRPTCSATRSPAIPRPSPTRAGSRWTGTTRCSAVRCAARRRGAGWPRAGRFVVPGLGVRCVSDEPWVTGAETCELVLALEAIGDRAGRGRAVRADPASARCRRRVLDRLAVRQPGTLPGRAQQLDLGRDGAGRRRAVRGHRRVRDLPDGVRAVGQRRASRPVGVRLRSPGRVSRSRRRCAPAPGAIPPRSPRQTRRTLAHAGRSGTAPGRHRQGRGRRREWPAPRPARPTAPSRHSRPGRRVGVAAVDEQHAQRHPP